MLNQTELRVAGLLLTLSGWPLMLASVILLSSMPLRTAFALASLAVQILGLTLLARTYLPARKKRHA